MPTVRCENSGMRTSTEATGALKNGWTQQSGEKQEGNLGKRNEDSNEIEVRQSL